MGKLNDLDARSGGALSGTAILLLFVAFWVGIGIWMAMT